MIKGVGQLYIRFALFVLLVLALHLVLLWKSLPEIYLESKPWLIYLFLIPIEILGLILITSRHKKKSTSVMNNFILLMIAKMLGAIFFLSPWIFEKDQFTRPFIYQFFTVFFLFLIAEVTFIVKLLQDSDEKIENFD
ncbi:MAG: hypothetical protein ACPG21_01860 [Crocinitomicaceae bacterium]